MKSLVFWGVAYIIFIIVVACIIPTVMIPVFQGFGLSLRDVVGFAVTITFMAVLLLVAFGASIWSKF